MVIWTERNKDERVFSCDIDPNLLIWHRDDEPRDIEVLESCDGWSFQRENDLPRPLNKGDKLHINWGDWHRLYKSNPQSNLVLKIKKLPH